MDDPFGRVWSFAKRTKTFERMPCGFQRPEEKILGFIRERVDKEGGATLEFATHENGWWHISDVLECDIVFEGDLRPLPIHVAFLMGTQPRLGKDSGVQFLTGEPSILQRILGYTDKLP